MATTTKGKCWLELARIVEILGGQVQALADAGGRECERACGPEQGILHNQVAVTKVIQRHVAGAGGAG